MASSYESLVICSIFFSKIVKLVLLNTLSNFFHQICIELYVMKRCVGRSSQIVGQKPFPQLSHSYSFLTPLTLTMCIDRLLEMLKFTKIEPSFFGIKHPVPCFTR